MDRQRTMGAAPVLLAAMAALLAGCAGSDGNAEFVPMVRQEAPVAATTFTAAAVPPSVRLPDGVVLVGMQAQRIDDLLGQPEIVMAAGPAQWWRYEVGSCAVDVFVMGAGAPGDMVVSHVAARTAQARPAAPGRDLCQGLDAYLNRSVQADAAELPAVPVY